MAKSLSDKQTAPAEIIPVRFLPASPARRARASLKVWRGLIWCEWYAHSKFLLAIICAWIMTVWTLPLFTHPGWILAFGIVYALLAGPAIGGGDVIEGCEEYAFALPVTRSERFLARLMIGGGLLLVFTVLDPVTLGIDLSQAIALFYLDTGLMRPVEALNPRLLYGLVFAFPVALFAVAFSLAANARARSLVFTAWFWAALAALIVLRLGLRYEYWQWRAWTGYVVCPSLLMVSLIALGLGYQSFCRKEIVQPSKPIALPSYWWIWLLLILGGLLLTAFLVVSLSDEFSKIIGR